MKTKYFWAMKKAQRPLIWDTFSITNRYSNKYFEIPCTLTHSKIINGDIFFGEKAVNDIRDAVRANVSQDIRYASRIAKRLYEL